MKHLKLFENFDKDRRILQNDLDYVSTQIEKWFENRDIIIGRQSYGAAAENASVNHFSSENKVKPNLSTDEKQEIKELGVKYDKAYAELYSEE